MNKKDYELIAKCLGQSIKFYTEQNFPDKLHKDLVGSFYDRVTQSLARDNHNFNHKAFQRTVEAEAMK